jgi:hypothetical protein
MSVSAAHLSNRRMTEWVDRIALLTVKRMDELSVLETTNGFGERLIKMRLPGLASTSIYDRFAALALKHLQNRDLKNPQLKGEESSVFGFADAKGTSDIPPDSVVGHTRLVRVVLRFLLGRTVCKYLLAKKKDKNCVRGDTVEDIRSLLMDAMQMVGWVINYPDVNAGGTTKVARNVAVAVQDAVYSDVYNIALVVLRAARFLRRSGAGFVAIPALSWISLCINKMLLPLQDVTFLPFRTRLQLELLACMEAANSDSYASCLKTAETAL